MEFNVKSVSAGFSHSAAIDENQYLYIWGDNSKSRLCKPPQDVDEVTNAKYKTGRLIEPVVVPLKFQFKSKDSNEKKISEEQRQKMMIEEAKNRGMKAIDVSCGPNNVFVIARDQEKLEIHIERGEIEKIQTDLKQKLLTTGNLVNFFNLKERYQTEIQDYLNELLGQDSEGEIKQATAHQENEALQQVLEKLSPYEIYIEVDVFVKRIQHSKISQNRQLLNKFASQILEHRKKMDENNNKKSASAKELSLGDIEDYCMGYLQNNNKLFVFGEVHKSLCNFEQQQEDDAGEEQDAGEGQNIKNLNEDEDNLINQIKNQYKIIKRPSVIKFPKFTQPIVCVSVGAEHALVLTIQYQLYAWGEGKNGALGFGNREKQLIPRQLEIIDHNGLNFQIIQIAAGKFHSMCLSTNNNIFSWGESSHGRLGHGKIDSDILSPKEIYMLSKQKPIMIAAGESHSAAINHRHTLFTWGSGSFGKLGHGDEVRKFIPQAVQSLESQEIVYVSCGTFHTLAINNQGQIFAFGQNKYGKLGIHYSNSKDVGKYEEPIKINLYKQQALKDAEILINKAKSTQVVASTNHSMAITEGGQIYSWGYDGKALLGRQSANFPEIGLTIQAGNL